MALNLNFLFIELQAYQPREIECLTCFLIVEQALREKPIKVYNNFKEDRKLEN